MKFMVKQFDRKALDLSLEFDSYVARHPDIVDGIPQGAVLIVTHKADPAFSKYVIRTATQRKTRRRFIEAQKVGKGWVIHAPVTT